MTANKRIFQFFLIFIGLFLIIATYFFYPKFLKDEAVIDDVIETESTEHTVFENVEYKGLYDINIPFTVKSEKAHILEEDPNIVYMTNMRVTLNTKDGRTIVITSLKGRYNKESFDLFFENSVKAVDGETTVLAENLNLLANERATAYNDVVLTNEKGSLQADKIDYDFKTKHYKISMFSDKKVKIKLIK